MSFLETLPREILTLIANHAFRAEARMDCNLRMRINRIQSDSSCVYFDAERDTIRTVTIDGWRRSDEHEEHSLYFKQDGNFSETTRRTTFLKDIVLVHSTALSPIDLQVPDGIRSLTLSQPRPSFNIAQVLESNHQLSQLSIPGTNSALVDQLVNHPNLYNITKLTIEDIDHRSNLQSLWPKFPNLRYLKLTSFTRFESGTPFAFQGIAENCLGIEKLAITTSNDLEELEPAVEQCIKLGKTLLKLTLDFVIYEDLENLQMLLATIPPACPKIKIDLPRCTHYEVQTLGRYLNAIKIRGFEIGHNVEAIQSLTTLKDVSLYLGEHTSDDGEVSYGNGRHILEVLLKTTGKNLKKFSLVWYLEDDLQDRNNVQIPDDVAELISKNTGKLDVLHLEGANDVNAVANIIKSNPNLKESELSVILDFEGPEQVSIWAVRLLNKVLVVAPVMNDLNMTWMPLYNINAYDGVPQITEIMSRRPSFAGRLDVRLADIVY